MAQFVAFDPKVEVASEAILAYIAAMGEDILPILEKHGITDIKPNQWYPQQAWLDAFREIAEGDFSAVLDLVSIGMKIPENALWPPEVQTIEDALFSIDVAYHMNHRKGEIGCYKATKVGEREITVFCKNPYPDDFDYGIVYGTARRYRPEGSNPRVVHDGDAPCRKAGADSCTYHVTW